MRVVAVALLLGCAEADPASRASADQPTDAKVVSDVRRVVLSEGFVELTIGEPPRRFTAHVERLNGRVDTIAVTAFSAADTTVAQVVDGALIGREVGQTSLRFEVEGVRARGVVSVQERVFADSVWLGPGEVRAWELRPGWYRISVDNPVPAGEPRTLELGADLICVPQRAAVETIACRVTQPTRIILRHTGVSPRRDRALAVVGIYRTPR